MSRRAALLTAFVLTSLFLAPFAASAADISGKWTFHVKFTIRSGDPWFEFHQDGQKLTGTYHGYFGEAPVSGTVNGNEIDFTAVSSKGTGHYKGTLTGDMIKGTAKYPFPLGTGHFEGKRTN
jgi:hypothetical protein